MTLGKDAVLHLNSNSSKAEERRPRTIGLLLLCNHITAFFNSAISQVFFLEIEKNIWHYFREIVDEGEKQLNRDFRTTLISLFCAAQSYFFSLVFLLVFFLLAKYVFGVRPKKALHRPTRVSPRFFDQVGHQSTNASIGNKYFFTK